MHNLTGADQSIRGLLLVENLDRLSEILVSANYEKYNVESMNYPPNARLF